MAAGTLLSFSRSPHWGVRAWDFPRVQIAVATSAAAVAYAALFRPETAAGWAFLAVCAATVAWQVWKIHPYTRLARPQVQRSARPPAARDDPRRATLRLLISNVLMENRDHASLLRRVEETDPDVVLAVETDEGWARDLEALAARYPHVVRRPQDNWYGLMLFSRLELVEPQVRFLVQDDIPSVHTGVRLPSGDVVHLHGLHPRPPEPLRDMSSAPRDAELVRVGRAIGEGDTRPTVVAGDLNDVAWSPVSELFLRLSGLLDPRVGRGMFNSFDATSRLFRYPLDHVFHSNHFRLVELRRLAPIGSDHFPMLVELSFEPEARPHQPEPRASGDDHANADEKMRTQAEAAATGDDRPNQVRPDDR
jgi:endonuclease/exonuclease/phosphatase (EEP) superfamily protein YafD